MPRRCLKHGCEMESVPLLGHYVCHECARELDGIGKLFANGLITKREARARIEALDLPEMWHLGKDE